MTNQERRDHNVIDGKRRKRIAAGSGTTVQEVNSGLEAVPANAHHDEAIRRNGRPRQNERPRQTCRSRLSFENKQRLIGGFEICIFDSFG